MKEWNAIDLDQYLLNLNDEQRKYVRSQFSTAWHDQVHASHESVIDTVVASKGMRDISPVTAQTVPGWLRWSALDAFIKWVKGDDIKTCQHVMSWRSPMPVLAAAWKPGYVTCEYCAPVLFKVYGDADKTCDGCGHICDVDNGDLISTTTIVVGPFGYQAGVCSSCDPCPAPAGMEGNRRTGQREQ